MAYEKVWPDGWKDNEEGGTYIDAAGLNHLENGIAANDKAITALQESVKDLGTADETNLAEAKRYSDTTLTSAKKYSDTTRTVQRLRCVQPYQRPMKKYPHSIRNLAA